MRAASRRPTPPQCHWPPGAWGVCVPASCLDDFMSSGAVLEPVDGPEDPTVPAADPFRGGWIRDTVHGYVPFSAAEALLLERPFIQRLRYVRQSAAAHFVFPSMNVNRFEHSVGAMHVVSRLYVSAIANADDGYDSSAEGTLRQRLVGAACEAAGKQLLSYPTDKQHEERLLDYEVVMRRQGIAGPPAQSVRERVALMVVEQGLRFASLLHDVGHLAFSHDFELVLGEFFREHAEARDRWPNLARAAVGPDHLHELVGRRLGDWATTELSLELEDRGAKQGAFAALVRTSLRIAQHILDSPQKPLESVSSDVGRLYRWLFELISGEIDADRCDYVLRDASNYGIPGASFDLDRLVAGVTVFEAETPNLSGANPRRWRTALLPRAVSAAEEFLVSRSRLYSWAVYHHKAQQIAASLRLALEAHLDAACQAKKSDDVVGFLCDYDDLLAEQSALDGRDVRTAVASITQYDDMWWLERLKRDATLPGTPLARSKNPNRGDGNADVLTALYRLPGRPSLWKKPIDFIAPERLRLLNECVPTDADQARRWRTMTQALRNDRGVVVHTFSFRPYKPDLPADESESVPSMLQVVRTQSDGTPYGEPLTRLSPAVQSLWSASQNSIKVLAFGERGTNDEGIAVLRTYVLDRIRDGMHPE